MLTYAPMGESNGLGQFARAVLGLNGGPTDPLVVGSAARMAKQAKTELIAVHVIEVDWTHDLAEVVTGSQQRASEVLDRAEGQAERYGVGLKTTLLQSRDVGAAIVDEAAAVNADVIVLGLRLPDQVRRRFRDGTGGPLCPRECADGRPDRAQRDPGGHGDEHGAAGTCPPLKE